MMKIFKSILLLTIGVLLWTPEADATHIVGGEMRYRCLGGDFYRIYLTMRRDCFNGAVDAQFDNPAFVTAYGRNGEVIEDIGQSGVFSLEYMQDDTLNEILTSTCQVIGPDVCVHTTTYFFDVRLRYRPGGYLFVHQRCCFNSTLVNVVDPLRTGLTVSIQLTEDALEACNSSPDFESWPSIYLCQGDTFDFDHSARDVNGDSIVYSLCTPYAGASIGAPKPTEASPPPYRGVVWRAPYGLNNLMGGVPLTIDPNTGLLSGAPNTVGQFLVGVCMEEFRDGRLLSVSRRAFEYNIRECPERPIADFDFDEVVCEGFDASFENTGTGTDFIWYFDYDNDRSQTSTDPNPTYTYTAPGTYNVGLFSIRDSACRDSVFKEIVIYGDADYAADFNYSIDECEEEVVLLLEDVSYDNLFGIREIEWIVESKDTIYRSNNKNERYVFDESDTIKVTLIAITDFDCVDTIMMLIPVNILDVQFLGDRPAICEGDSTRLVANPNPNFDYLWIPPLDLSCTDCPDPIAFPKSDIMYTVIVSDGNCSIRDTIFVTVNESLVVDILGDTIACQREVDLRASAGEAANAVWAYDRDMTDVFATGTNGVTVFVDSTLVVYLMSATTEDCQGMDSIVIRREEVFLEAIDSLRVCEGDTFQVSVSSVIQDHQLTYEWSPANRIVSGANTDSPLFSFPTSGNYSISYKATNQYDCEKEGVIHVRVEDLPEVDFSFEKNCDSLVVLFSNLSENGDYVWHFGDGDTSTMVNPSHEYAVPGDYEVRLTVQGFCYNEIVKNINVGIIEVELPDTVISCAGEPVELNPDPDTTLIYTWSPGVFLDDENAPNPIATVITSTNFTVVIQDTTFEDCFIEREVFVLVTDPIEFETNTSDTILCYSDSLVLRATGDYNYCWLNSNGDTLAMNQDTLLVIVTDEEEYTVIAKDEYDCSESQNIKVKRFNLDVAIVDPDTICFMDAIRLEITNQGEGMLEYMWSPTESILEGENSSNPLVSPDVTTTYIVKITNEHGCEYFDSVQVVVDRVDPRPFIEATPDTIYRSDSTQLMVIGGPYNTYEWFPTKHLTCTDCPDPIAYPDSTTTYGVWVTNLRGCIDSSFITIHVVQPNCDETDVYVPNAFSPNGDDINDEWQVLSNFVDFIEVYVYDRWGEEVYHTTDKNAAWDGTYEGEFLRPDVYAYYIKVICVGQDTYTVKGNVTLMR